jgi:hypothetical protein
VLVCNNKQTIVKDRFIWEVCSVHIDYVVHRLHKLLYAVSLLIQQD